MFSRYRSYTCYSEENGKLVPSVEPKDISQNITSTKIDSLVDNNEGTNKDTIIKEQINKISQQESK